MFKYLVTKQDPQRWFTLSVLILNFGCFILISLSYIIINIKTTRSSKNLAGRENKGLARRNRKLQLKVSAIIFTDFLCWIPFMIVCFLHFGGVIDATLWYPIFSSIILPINSVINPLLYDSLLWATLVRSFKASNDTATSVIATIRRQTNTVREHTAECENGEHFGMKRNSGNQHSTTQF